LGGGDSAGSPGPVDFEPLFEVESPEVEPLPEDDLPVEGPGAEPEELVVDGLASGALVAPPNGARVSLRECLGITVQVLRDVLLDFTLEDSFERVLARWARAVHETWRFAFEPRLLPRWLEASAAAGTTPAVLKRRERARNVTASAGCSRP
jgi:hypothetical protein